MWWAGFPVGFSLGIMVTTREDVKDMALLLGVGSKCVNGLVSGREQTAFRNEFMLKAEGMTPFL